MTYEQIIKEVAKDMGLPERLVDKAYRAFWKAVREHIKSLPLKQDLSDEELLKLQPNMNIPSIGKLYIPLDKYHKIRKEYFKSEKLKRERYVTHQEN